MGVKVVNPGGISAFKFNQRKLDVDEPHVHWQVTPRQVVHTLARALKELGVPHPLHIHGSNLGVAGNIALDAGDDRGARRPARAPDAHPVPRLRHRGAEEVLVGRAATGRGGQREPAASRSTSARSCSARPSPPSGDTMRQYAQSDLANPRKWVGADIELDGRLRRRAVPLPRAELRQRAAVGDRAGDLPAGQEPLAGGADDRPSERRPVHQLPAPDPPADGPQLPRGAARQAAPGGGGELRAEVDHARADAGRDRGHDPRRPGEAARPERPRPPRRRRGGRHRGLPRAGRPRGDVPHARLGVQGRHAGGARAARSPPRRWAARTSSSPATTRRSRRPCASTGPTTPRSTSTTSAITHDELCSCCNGGRLLPAACFTGTDA